MTLINQPLTKRWRNIIGFEPKYGIPTLPFKGGEIQYYEGFYYIHSGLGQSRDYGFKLKIKSVSDLQQLAFLLSGIELKFKYIYEATI